MKPTDMTDQELTDYYMWLMYTGRNLMSRGTWSNKMNPVRVEIVKRNITIKEEEY